MIKFLNIEDDDFTFSSLFQSFEEGQTDMQSFGSYPFYKLKYFFWDKSRLPLLALNLDEEKLENFEMFKNISKREDYFYLIAYNYFLNIKKYDYDYKEEGRMQIENVDGSLKTVSFFEPLYQSLVEEKNKSQTLLRHEYIISKNKYLYINKLTELLLNDFNDLDSATRKERNVFAKYGLVVKEVYLEIFKDFHINFIDYLSNKNFNIIKNIVNPSRKEEQSFEFKKRSIFRPVMSSEERVTLINSILSKFIEEKFVSEKTTFQQIDDLFNNKRREYNKIIWLGNITELRTLYKVLIDNNIIMPTKNRHWINFCLIS